MKVEVSLFFIIFEFVAKRLHMASTLISSIIQIVSQLVEQQPITVDIIRIISILLFLLP